LIVGVYPALDAGPGWRATGYYRHSRESGNPEK